MLSAPKYKCKCTNKNIGQIIVGFDVAQEYEKQGRGRDSDFTLLVDPIHSHVHSGLLGTDVNQRSKVKDPEL